MNLRFTIGRIGGEKSLELSVPQNVARVEAFRSMTVQLTAAAFPVAAEDCSA
jgi:hypothetical protein